MDALLAQFQTLQRKNGSAENIRKWPDSDMVSIPARFFSSFAYRRIGLRAVHQCSPGLRRFKSGALRPVRKIAQGVLPNDPL